MIRAVLFDLGGTLIEEDGTGQPLPYAVEMLKRLRTRGYKMGVVCNATEAKGKDVEEILRKVGILEFFDDVVVSTDIGFSKPQPQIFRIALDHLSAEPSEAAMIGNRLETDILGANSIGIKTVLLRCNEKYRSQPTELGERPNIIVDSLRHILTAVESLGFGTSFEGAHLMLSFLRNPRRADDKIDRILENESYQLMIKHHDLTKERMRSVLESLGSGHPPQEEVEKLVYDSLISDMERLDKVGDFLEEIHKQWDGISYDSTEAALEYLPPGTGIKANVHFIFGGHSDAYTSGEENIILNISMFLGNLTYLEMILPHELHHMGLSSVETHKTKPKDPKEDKLNLLIGGTKGEGLATYVTYNVMKGRGDELWSRTFQERMKGINEHFQRIEAAICEISQDRDTGSKKELYERFFSSMGIAYFVGCKMAEIIEEVYGRDALINCMPKPPEEFFRLYNDAAKKKGEYAFNEKTIEYLNANDANFRIVDP